MAIKVHGVLLSSCVTRVLLCLAEKGLPYELVLVDLVAAAHKKQPYLSLNPFGQIPALEDGEVKLFESKAITKYLARKYKESGIDLLKSNDLTESTIVDTWMEVEAHQFHPPMSIIIRQMIVNQMYGLSSEEKIIEAELERLGKVLDVYEKRLSEIKYLAGDHYTLADLYHLPYLIYFMRSPKAFLVTSRPHVNSWWEDISSRPASIKVVENMKL